MLKIWVDLVLEVEDLVLEVEDLVLNVEIWF
jgi:hypothetical protein